jgi:FdhE protein
MTAPDTALHGLKRQRPEWKPWLSVIEEIVREAAAGRWEASVPSSVQPPQTGIPLLVGATLAVDTSSVRRLLRRLTQIASLSGSANIATLESALNADLDILTLFNASLCQDSDLVDSVATARGADPGALQAVIALLTLPLLQACNRRWASSISESWVEGYCPVCGSWPAFAEVRGIERSRAFRCARCGGQWHARVLSCPYCTEGSHDEHVSLVPENGGAHRGVIDACKRCSGYVKTFTMLQGCQPDTVMLEDLATVHFDVAALEQGYTRPSGAGYPLEVTVTDKGASGRLFGWNA